MHRHENPGRKPRWPPDTQVGIEFRNGQKHTGLVRHFRFEPWDFESDWDITFVWKA